MDRWIRKMCYEAEVEEQEVRNGGQRGRVSKVRAEIAYYLSHELGVCSSAITKAVQKLESQDRK